MKSARSEFRSQIFSCFLESPLPTVTEDLSLGELRGSPTSLAEFLSGTSHGLLGFGANSHFKPGRPSIK